MDECCSGQIQIPDTLTITISNRPPRTINYIIVDDPIVHLYLPMTKQEEKERQAWWDAHRGQTLSQMLRNIEL